MTIIAISEQRRSGKVLKTSFLLINNCIKQFPLSATLLLVLRVMRFDNPKCSEKLSSYVIASLIECLNGVIYLK
jgi:hypothetical protein